MFKTCRQRGHYAIVQLVCGGQRGCVSGVGMFQPMASGRILSYITSRIFWNGRNGVEIDFFCRSPQLPSITVVDVPALAVRTTWIYGPARQLLRDASDTKETLILGPSVFGFWWSAPKYGTSAWRPAIGWFPEARRGWGEKWSGFSLTVVRSCERSDRGLILWRVPSPRREGRAQGRKFVGSFGVAFPPTPQKITMIGTPYWQAFWPSFVARFASSMSRGVGFLFRCESVFQSRRLPVATLLALMP